MQIEAGKYYRTRDGRKVGPMELKKPSAANGGGWDELRSGISFRWYGDGSQTSEPLDDDLIAEWTDEQETPHFTHMLAEMQDLAENYGYTINQVSTSEGPLVVDFTLTN